MTWDEEKELIRLDMIRLYEKMALLRKTCHACPMDEILQEYIQLIKGLDKRNV